jgi:hypothetical protein
MSTNCDIIVSVPRAPLFRILEVSLNVNGFDIIDSTESDNYVACTIKSNERTKGEQISLKLFGFGNKTAVSIQEHDNGLNSNSKNPEQTSLGRRVIQNIFWQIHNEYVRSLKIRE